MVEFAIIAAPIFLLLFGIIEAGLIFVATYALDNATGDAGRLIRTGQAQANAMQASDVIAAICNETVLLLNCSSTLQLDVESFSSFSLAASPPGLNNKGVLNTNFQYSPGGGGDIVLVTTYYEWPLIGLLSGSLGNMGDGNRLLQTSVLFRNEPFGN
jgi:Flp pilus assembly protein TadG